MLSNTQQQAPYTVPARSNFFDACEVNKNQSSAVSCRLKVVDGIALLVDVIEKKFVIFDFWLVVVVANIGGCFLEFACVKNNATIADQRAS